jgi:hypothetical protein
VAENKEKEGFYIVVIFSDTGERAVRTRARAKERQDFPTPPSRTQPAFFVSSFCSGVFSDSKGSKIQASRGL